MQVRPLFRHMASIFAGPNLQASIFGVGFVLLAFGNNRLLSMVLVFAVTPKSAERLNRHYHTHLFGGMYVI